MCSSQAPRLGGSNDAIIPHRLGDEDLGCLYGTKDTSLIVRRLLRNKTHRKPCGTIPHGGHAMLRICTHIITEKLLKIPNKLAWTKWDQANTLEIQDSNASGTQQRDYITGS